MRIALFTRNLCPKVDGIVTTLCQTVKQLDSLGHEVLIFAPQGGVSQFGQSHIFGTKKPRFPALPRVAPLLSPRLHAHGDDRIPAGPHSLCGAALLGVAGLYYGGGDNGGALHLPLVVSYHTDFPKYLHYYHLGLIERYVWPLLRLRHNRATVNLCTSTPWWFNCGNTELAASPCGRAEWMPISSTPISVPRKCARAQPGPSPVPLAAFRRTSLPGKEY